MYRPGRGGRGPSSSGPPPNRSISNDLSGRWNPNPDNNNNKSADHLGGRFVEAHRNMGHASANDNVRNNIGAAASSSIPLPGRSQGTELNINRRGRGSSNFHPPPFGRGRGNYSNIGASEKRDFYSPERPIFSQSKSHTDGVRNTTFTSMDSISDDVSAPNRQVSSSRILFQPPENRVDASIRNSEVHHPTTRYSSSTRPDVESNQYPNKRLRSETEWNHPSVDDNQVKCVKTLNFTKPPLKLREMDEIPQGKILAPIVSKPSGITRHDPRMEAKKYPPRTNTSSNMGEDKPYTSRLESSTFSRRMQFMNLLQTSSPEDGEIEMGEIEEGCFEQDDRTVYGTLGETFTEPDPIIITRPVSPVAAPPSGLAIALSRLADLQSQMEYQYAKYLILCKETEICKVKTNVIKNFDATVELAR